VRAELEALATGLAATKITKADLHELEEAERRFARLTRALRAREPGGDRRALTAEWMRANHGFHDNRLASARAAGGRSRAADYCSRLHLQIWRQPLQLTGRISGSPPAPGGRRWREVVKLSD